MASGSHRLPKPLFYFIFRLSQWCLILARSYTKHIVETFLDSPKATTNFADFYEWLDSDLKDKSALFIYRSIWINLLAVECFRKGVAWGNPHFRIAGEKKMFQLFYAASHPVYQSALLDRDLRRLTMAPELNRCLLAIPFSYSTKETGA